MENLMQPIKHIKLPQSWDSATGYPRKNPLSFLFDDLLKRHDQMDEWISELKIPKCLNITLL